ncbi:MAG: hypothetical protein IJP35_07555 [Clostridia bacterium]|nr:hypothetical protein [Clostridia bacterium]
MSELLRKWWVQEILAGIVMVAIVVGSIALSSISYVEWPVIRLIRECKIFVLGEDETVLPQIDTFIANSAQLNVGHGFKTTSTIYNVNKIDYDQYLSYKDIIAQYESSQLTNFRKSTRIFKASGKVEISNEYGYSYAIPYVQLAAYDSRTNECGGIDNSHIINERINQQTESLPKAEYAAEKYISEYLAKITNTPADVATDIFRYNIPIDTVNHTGINGFRSSEIYDSKWDQWFNQENCAYHITGTYSLDPYYVQQIYGENVIGRIDSSYECFVVYNPTTEEWLVISDRSSPTIYETVQLVK